MPVWLSRPCFPCRHPQLPVCNHTNPGASLPSPPHLPSLAPPTSRPPLCSPSAAAAGLNSLPDTPSSSDTMGVTALPLPPYISAPRMPAPVAIAPPQHPSGFSSLLSSALFGGVLQPPPPLPSSQALRLGSGGGYTRVESPISGRSSGTQVQQGSIGTGSVLDEALNLLSYDSAQVCACICMHMHACGWPAGLLAAVPACLPLTAASICGSCLLAAFLTAALHSSLHSPSGVLLLIPCPPTAGHLCC